MSTDTSLMTAEEFLALPDDGKERWLIRGHLREKGDGEMTLRNRFHTWVEAQIAFVLKSWLEDRPHPQGAVHSGEVGCRLTADTVVGIDVAYFSQAVAERQTAETTLLEGAPLLAVEILSPSDRHEEVTEKVRVYLDCGVQAVWIVDPDFRTVRLHRPGAAPEMFNEAQTLSGGEVLPGLEIMVANLFPKRP
jgi:Uma2 family endonuclease